MKEKFNYSTISVDEIWKQTLQLRFLKKSVAIDENTCKTQMILQQLYVSNLGNREWKDIPTETEL